MKESRLTGSAMERPEKHHLDSRSRVTPALLAVLFWGVTFCTHPALAGGAPPAPRELLLTDGWKITQDVHDLGETTRWFEPGFAAEWQPIERLAHLQLLLASQPYFGRELRYFNEHPWWYRLEFSTEKGVTGATLRFEGVDYFAKVWLNGTLLGEHEGYVDPFEFEVGSLLRADRPNVLVVKVSSPWDHEFADPKQPVFAVVRNLQKGSYEHADGFVQRDVNPIGIWRPVSLIFHGDLHAAAPPAVSVALSKDQHRAAVKIAWAVTNEGAARKADFVVRVRQRGSVRDVASASRTVHLKHGTQVLEQSLAIQSPKLWTTWDQGDQPIYEVSAAVGGPKDAAVDARSTFGIRSVELHRSAKETRFFINGKPLYLRGTTYWPDLYLSNMTKERYERDLAAAKRLGVNAIRVHVHTENPEFYELCDEMGFVLLQDNDLNWMFPNTRDFTERAIAHLGTTVRYLDNHPSVIAWIAMNEVAWGEDYPDLALINKTYSVSDRRTLGHRLAAEVQKIDPTRPVIEDSIFSNELTSGDTHDYRGSLDGGGYFDIVSKPDDALGSPPKLVTEFGVDAPPVAASLQRIPALAERLASVMPKIPQLQDYQYHLLKFYIEHYRIMKYTPNAGYFQFMFVDFSPQSFYGVLDYWGQPKAEGGEGGIRALEESNQPIGIFLAHDKKPRGLYVVNDLPRSLGDCIAHWRVTDGGGAVIAEGSQALLIPADSVEESRDLEFAVDDQSSYAVSLTLMAKDGKLLARNSYQDPFRQRERPAGYPERIDDELGMRLWSAGPPLPIGVRPVTTPGQSR